MTQSDAYKEEISSQIPALQLLIAMGWQYLTPGEALHLRGGREKNVVLTGVLEPWLRTHNAIRVKGETRPFSDANIAQAIDRLVDEPLQSLLLSSERIYELLTLGTSLTQIVQGDRKSHSLHYIDWQRPANNVYHVSDEFSVEKRGSHETRRPAIVLFVNGIPLAVIECKRPDLEAEGGEKAVAEAISQMVRNQGEGEIPHLFVFSQLLVAISPHEGLYATTGTPRKVWALGREQGDVETAIQGLINRPLDAGTEDRLYNWRPFARRVREHFAALGERLPTGQDRLIYALLRPERLLELAYQFVVYDGGVKKIARYQQYFAIKVEVN